MSVFRDRTIESRKLFYRLMAIIKNIKNTIETCGLKKILWVLLKRGNFQKPAGFGYGTQAGNQNTQAGAIDKVDAP